MIRTQIYLDEAQKDRLERLSRQKNRPMAELIREASDDYPAVARPEWGTQALQKAFGIWKEEESRGLPLPDAIIAATPPM